MKKILGLLLVFALVGCGPRPDMPMEKSYHTPASNVSQGRFKVTRIGVFEDDLAYHDRRGIYVIIDTTNGREFVGISGVGISETGSHMAGKTSVRDER